MCQPWHILGRVAIAFDFAIKSLSVRIKTEHAVHITIMVKEIAQWHNFTSVIFPELKECNFEVHKLIKVIVAYVAC